MAEPKGAGLSKAERKKARRKAQAAAEKIRGREMDALAAVAVEQALRLAPEVADGPSGPESERIIDVLVTTPDAARFVLKRVNEALTVGEWLEVVSAWVWEANVHVRPPLSEQGRQHGVELRLEQASRLD